MRISVSKEPFVHALARTTNVVERRSTREILEYLLIEAKQQDIRLAATDLRISLEQTVRAEVQETGAAAFRARMLFDIVRELPSDTVTLEIEESQWAVIASGRSVFRIPALPAETYPSLPIPPETFGSASAGLFRDMLDKTLYAASNDETRAFLCGVYMKAIVRDDGTPVLRMVATDGHRLSLAERDVSSPLSVLEEGVILPKKGLTGLRALLDETEGDFKLAYEDGKVFARFEGCTIALTLVEGDFPNYEEVIPTSCAHRVVSDRTALIDALKRVSVLSDPQTHTVIMELGETGVELRSLNSQQGDAKEWMDAEVEGAGVRIAFNASYLIDAVRHAEGETVRVEIADPVLPCLVKSVQDPGYMAVIMPIRID